MIIGFISVALYNSVELVVLILLTFKRYKGLYFWALLLSTMMGTISASIAALLDTFNIGPLWLFLTLSNTGFWFMVPGQSIVLYSRLNLVSHSYNFLRSIRYLILIDTIILSVPTTTLSFGSAYTQTASWNRGFNVMVRMQLTWFCLQELWISGLYILETTRLIRLSPWRDSSRIKILYQLLAINCIAVLLDVCLLGLEYAGLYFVQVFFKLLVYSIKLKLEFAVMGRLVFMSNFSHQIQVSGISSS